MKELVFLLEEPSMKALLDNLLPQVLPDDITFLTIKHEGKNDLEKSIPRKLRAFRKPDVYFIVLRDQDTADCIAVKQRLLSLCREGQREDTLVRVVCHELESWFLGDLQAVEQAFNIVGLGNRQNERKFRDPDRISNPSQVIKDLVPAYQKISGAREISLYMNLQENKSTSFNTFLSGLRRIINDTV